MDVREIREPGEWDACASDWRRIAEASDQATVFQTWEWLRPWWTHFGCERQLWVLMFREDGRTVGFAPLYLPPPHMPMRVARLIGAGASDYLDGLALPGYESKVVAAFWSYLAHRRRQWDCLDLHELSPDSLLASHSPGTGRLRVVEQPASTCPYLPLPESWQTFLSGLPRTFRSDFQRRWRKMNRECGHCESRFATMETVEADMAALFAVHQSRWRHRWRPGKFAAPATRAFHLDVGRRQLEADRLRLNVLRVGGAVCSATYCFQFKRTRSYYLSGFDPAFSQFGPGKLLIAQAIEHAIDHDRAQVFDFLRGTESYKYDWGVQDRHNRRWSVTRPGLRPFFVSTARRAADQAKVAAVGCIEKLLPVSRQRT